MLSIPYLGHEALRDLSITTLPGCLALDAIMSDTRVKKVLALPQSWELQGLGAGGYSSLTS